MSILSFFPAWDTALLLKINGAHTAFWDLAFYAFTNKFIWIPFYFALLILVINRYKKDAIWVILSIVLCVIIADQVASGFFKETVQRFRPSHEPSLQNVLHIYQNYRCGKYGFVSSHASNTFGIALLFITLFRNNWLALTILAWSIINMYSRMYLGVHYPLDIMGGMLVGAFAAFICYRLLLYFLPEINQTQTVKNRFWGSHTMVISVFAVSTLLILIYSFVKVMYN